MQEQKRYAVREGNVNLKEKPAAEMRTGGRVVIDEVLKGLLYAAAAYLLGSVRLMFGSFPLGFALLCAANRKIPYILLGLVASTVPAVPYPSVYIGAYVITVLIRVITRVFIDTVDGRGDADVGGWLKKFGDELFFESVSLRMTASALCAFIVGLYSLIAGSFRYYDLFAAIFAILFTPALTWVFAGWFEGRGEKKRDRLRFIAGEAALFAGLCYAARESSIMGISAAAFIGMFASLTICRTQGMLAGTITGFFCGIAYDPLYAPVFVFASIAYGLLSWVSVTLAGSAAFAAGMIWGLYIDGIGALQGLLSGLLLSAAAFCGADKAGFFDARASPIPAAAVRVRGQSEVYRAAAEVSQRRIEANEERLRAVAESFASLSEVFYNLSDRLRRPGILDLRRVCDRCFEKACDGCAKREVCWGLDYSASLDMIALICSALHEAGRADVECVPDNIKRRCSKIDNIINDINNGCAALTRAVLQSEKMSVFALDYDAMAKILNDALEEQRAEFDRSAEYEGKVSAVLQEMGILPEVLYVYGARRRFVSARGIDASVTRFEAAAVRSKLENIFDCRLEDPLIEISSDSGKKLLSMTLTGKRKLSIERAALTSAAEGSEDGVCGDSATTFETGRDYFYALISDGMGKGSGAAFSSGITSLFLEKMLSAGNRSRTALKMLNGVLRARSGAREMEYSATVDLLEIDLLTGETSLVKSGAAPTYIRRKGDIFRLHSKTVPLGILTALDAQQTKLELGEGDVVIMVSDGVTEAGCKDGGECEWLPELLCREWEDDLDRMTKKIVGRAQSLGSRDDLSVIIVRVNGY